MWFICLIIGFACGAYLIYTIQEPKMKSFVKLDEQTASKNQELQIELATLQTRKDEVLSNLNDLEKQAQEASQKFLARRSPSTQRQMLLSCPGASWA